MDSSPDWQVAHPDAGEGRGLSSYGEAVGAGGGVGVGDEKEEAEEGRFLITRIRDTRGT